MRAPPRVAVFGLRGLDRVEGGIETHARELYPRLADLGLDICVLARSRYAVRTEDGGVRVRPLWAPPGRGIEAFGHALACVAYCLATRPDVVHVHGIGPGAFSGPLRRAGLRVVVTHHGHDYDATKWGAFARGMLRWGERRSVRDASAVIAVSRGIADQVSKVYGAPTVVIGNGVPSFSPRVHSRSPSSAAVSLATQPYLLVVGRITAHKRVLDVIEALDSPALSHLRLVVCGDRGGTDPYTGMVERAALRNARVILAGHVDSDDLGWLYERAECTVMASSYEGLPLAVLEAIGAGCPVLVSDIPAHVELELAPFQYYPVGDVTRLAEQLAHLLALERSDATVVQAEKVRNPRFDWDHIAKATAAVLDPDHDTTARGCAQLEATAPRAEGGRR